MTRKLRKKQADTILDHGATSDDIKIDYIVAALDGVAREMDRTWGIDRLPELVPSEMAARYGAAMHRLNEAINAGDPEEVMKRTGVCIRGLQAMDTHATSRKAKPASKEIWPVQADGRPWYIMRDDDAWPSVHAENPELARERVVSARVAAIALEQYMTSHPTVKAIKAAAGGGDVVALRPHSWNKKQGDEIPF